MGRLAHGYAEENKKEIPAQTTMMTAMIAPKAKPNPWRAARRRAEGAKTRPRDG